VEVPPFQQNRLEIEAVARAYKYLWRVSALIAPISSPRSSEASY